MDHVVLPRNPTRPLPSVKVYTTVEYDGGPFVSYLDRIGWTEQELLGWFSPRTSDEIHAVLQTWTYFGLLSTVLGHPVPISKLTGQKYGQSVINTKDLPAMVHAWVERESHLSPSQRLAHKENMKVCMEKVWHVYDALGMGRSAHNALDSYFCLSVAVLCELLIALHKYAYHPPAAEFPRFESIEIFLHHIPYAKDRLLDDMQSAGWCKAETRAFKRDLNPSELCLVYCLDRPGPDKDHSRCSDTKCLAYQISEDKYQTRHAVNGCQCEYVFCSQDKLADILLGDSGSIPLISHAEPVRGEDGKLWVTRLPSKRRPSHGMGSSRRIVSHAPFVAISHVWSDGLGNNRDNAIPLCQFRRLSLLVSGLYTSNQPPVLFWLDTLCFPLTPPEAYDTALIRMRESYEDADQVLVLDGYLLSGEGKMSDNELLLRIYCAPWSRRLWTLQEGYLPCRLVFRLADRYLPSRYFLEKMEFKMKKWLQGGAITRDELANEPLPSHSYDSLLGLRERESTQFTVKYSHAVMSETIRMFPHHVARLLSLDYVHHYRLVIFILQFLLAVWAASYKLLRGTHPGAAEAPMALDRVKKALTYRATSVAEDEPLCLGNLLGVDPARVVGARTREARMQVIWDDVFRPPRSRGHGALVFARGAKLRCPGFRWAPVSLMDGHAMEFYAGVPSFVEEARKVDGDGVSSSGLLVSLPGVVLHAWKLTQGNPFVFRTSQRNGYKVEWGDDRADGVDQGDELLSSNGLFAILTIAPLEKDGTPAFYPGLPGTGSWIANVVGRVQGQGSDRPVRLQLMASVSVERFSDNSVSVWTPDELKDGKDRILDPVAGRVVPREQWLIE